MISGFLLTVFSLNTFVGFACSIGIDVGFNSKHHHSEGEVNEIVVHIHRDGKKHIHHEKKSSFGHNESRFLNQQINNGKPGNETHNCCRPNEEKDNCCNDQVMRLLQVDKFTPQSLNITHPDFSVVIFHILSNITLPSLDLAKDIKQFTRNYHPPISNIRITIQSFQI